MQITISHTLAAFIATIWLIATITAPILEYLATRNIAAIEAAKICYANDLKANPQCGKWLKKVK